MYVYIHASRRKWRKGGEGNWCKMFLLILYAVGAPPYQPVKFSSEPDLPKEECQQLLLKYMPAHIRNTKITQRLFIKYGVYCKLRNFALIPMDL